MSKRFISVKAVLDRVCLSRTELYDRIKAGSFPASIALGPQKVVFVESQIDSWMQAQIESGNTGADWRRLRAQKAVASRRDRKVAA